MIGDAEEKAGTEAPGQDIESFQKPEENQTDEMCPKGNDGNQETEPDHPLEPENKTAKDQPDHKAADRLVSRFKSISNKENEEEEQEAPLAVIERLKQAEKNWGMRFSESSFQTATFIINQGGQDAKAREPGENLLAEEDDNEILKWCSAHYRDFYFSFFLAVCILDRQPYGMIDHMAREIHRVFLQRQRETDEKEDSSLIYKTRVTEVLGVTEYQDITRVRGVELEADFLRLPNPEQSVRYLQLLIKEFPEIRTLLCDYLSRKVIDTYWKKDGCMAVSGCFEALAVAGAADLQFFNDQVIKKFLSVRSSGTDFCLAVILKRMYQMDQCRQFVITCILQWGKLRNNPHCVLASLYLCGMIGGQECLVRDIWMNVLEEILEEVAAREKPAGMRYSDLLAEFFSSGNRNINYHKGMIHAFHETMSQADRAHDWQRKEGVGLVFLLFIMGDLGNSGFHGTGGGQDMLSIRIMEKLDRKTGMELAGLWASALRNRQWPREGWEVLRQYLGNYGSYDTEAADRLAFFFYWVKQALGNRQVHAFLQNCGMQGGKKAGLAYDIYKRLEKGE